ncbi:hypothetical protein THTE_3350 [Thermogutta terrifontis]|uniref:Uncharacterized protein n=1 Tax=Thermogutta terrifontis TaxID=1331910 RepID=A0A286RJ61_9BACT|nr:hypothetical protein THTE_3350 [Thermogutta terrifontis]
MIGIDTGSSDLNTNSFLLSIGLEKFGHDWTLFPGEQIS